MNSASFELDVGTPSAKRVRYDNVDVPETEILQVETDADGVQVDTVTITTADAVPSSQFEIEINSQAEDGDSEEIAQIHAGDLTGPNFGIVQDTQEIHTLGDDTLRPSDITTEDGSTLNAIGRALIQMQQGGHVVPSSSVQQSQFILTRSTSETDPSQNTPLYVMIPPASSAEILQAIGQTRPIAPKAGSLSGTYGSETLHSPVEVAANREAQRKATHNEVERRRRDRINELIKVLAQVVPACQKKDATTGSVVGYVYSKGTVLDKTVEYLKELIAQNEQLAGSAKLAEKSASALSVLQNQISVLEKENAFLRAQIIQFGIDAAASSGQSPAGNRQLLNSPLAQSLLNTVVTQTSPATAVTQPPPPSQANNAAAQQLLLSLAQSLTNSPLLTSLSQTPQSSPLTSAALQHLIGGPAPSQLQQSSPISSMQLSSSQLSSGSTLMQPPLNTGAGTLSSTQATPLLSSLVQTLTSIANNTSTSPSSALPKVSLPINLPSQPSSNGGGLSAAAAASLLNTLILAQNVLTNNTGSGPTAHGSALSLNDSSSVLGSVGLETVSAEHSVQ